MRFEASKGAEGARQGPCEAALYHLWNTKGSGEPIVEEVPESPYCSPHTATGTWSKDREEIEAENSQRSTFIRQEVTGK